MNLKKITTSIIYGFIFKIGFVSQIIEITPPFPTINDIITIHYDATQGNGGLQGISPVYTHTGVVTQSGLPSSWTYVQGNWGQADPNVLMTDLGNNLHEITIDIDQFYGFPANTNVANNRMGIFLSFDGKILKKINNVLQICKTTLVIKKILGGSIIISSSCCGW